MSVPDSPSIIFLADAHLRGPQDPNQTALVKFLLNQPPNPGGLVILGDLFDYLAGPNRAAQAAYRPVLEALERFSPFHYVEGNHDFDLSPLVLGPGAAVIHPQPVTLRLQGLDFHLLHGDRTSPADFGTRWLRWALQSTPLRFVRDRLLPDRIAFRLALAFATASRKQTWPGRASEHLHARRHALDELSRGRVHAVVYGHSHQPGLEAHNNGLIANPGPAVSCGSYLKLQGHTLTLHGLQDDRVLPPGPLELTRSRREPE